MKNMQENISGKLKKKNGFTLIEMLVVVAIIAILVLVSIPMITTSVDKAKAATDDANLRAAKATAVIEYLGNDKDAGTYYYDAENGKLVDTNAAKNLEAYSQTEDNKIVKVVIKDTPDADTDGTNIKCTWDAIPS